MIARPEITIEAQRQVVQEQLDARRSALERNRLGQFSTPRALAMEIAQYADTLLPGGVPIRFADPSIGTGSFYSAVLSVFGRARLASAIGVEIDPAFSNAARELWAKAGLDVMQGDFTRLVAHGDHPPSPNLILANPPYVRHHLMDPTEKERLQALVFKMTGIRISGLAGLYVYFLLLSTAWMEEGGCAAWLIPSEFMDVNYGMAVKDYLTSKVALARVHRFDPDDVQFADAWVSSVVLFFRKSCPGREHRVEFTFGGSLQHPQAAETLLLRELRESRKWTVFPRHSKNDRHILTTDGGPTLANFFQIRRGIATGNNKFFIMERTAAVHRRLPAQYLRPILPSPRNLKATVIDADAHGYPLVTPELCIIDCDLPEAVLQMRHPPLWEYLRTADILGIKEGYLVGNRIPWYRQERREPAPFLCTYMGRGSNDKRPFRFIWNRSAAIGTNLYLMLYPRCGLAEMLRRHPERASSVFDLLGQVTAYELRGQGRVYGGGLHKIEPGELGRISGEPLVKRWPELLASLPVSDTLPLFS